jgi:hypothetical protein
MAKKKRRSKAQRAATAKMQRAAKRARKCKTILKRSKKRKSARRKNPISSPQKRAARTRKKKKACRRAAGRRGAAKRHGRRAKRMPKMCAPKRKGRKAGKRKSARRSTHHTSGHRKSAKRVAAGRKAARTRARHRKSGYLTKADYDEAKTIVYESPRKRKRARRKGKRRHNPVVNPVRTHRRRRSYHRRHNPFFGNPIEGPGEFISGLFGVGVGYLFASATDRLLATHALAGTAGAYTDSPAAGQLYDTEAPLLPIWSDPIRVAVAIGVIFAPGLASRFISNPAAKAFLQLASYGAAARVAGAALEGGIAALGSTNPLVMQIYGPEVAAQTKLALMGTTTAPPGNQAAGTFAGVPKNRTLAAPPAPARTGVGDCCTPGTDVPPVPADPEQPLPQNFDMVPFTLGCGYDPSMENTDCFPIDNTNPVMTGPGAQLPPAAVAPAPAPAATQPCTGPNQFEYPPGSGNCTTGGPNQGAPAPMPAPAPVMPDVLSPPGQSVPQLKVVPPPQPYLPR